MEVIHESVKLMSVSGLVDAILVSPPPSPLLQRTHRDWTDWIRNWEAVQRSAFGDPYRFWDWTAIAGQVTGDASCRLAGIVLGDMTQGMCLLRWPAWCHGSEADHMGLPCVELQLLQSAPWNRARYVPRAELSGVGTVLLAFAARWSEYIGFAGRVTLLAVEEAEDFYRKKGLLELGKDHFGSLTRFEVTSPIAKRLLQ